MPLFKQVRSGLGVWRLGCLFQEKNFSKAKQKGSVKCFNDPTRYLLIISLWFLFEVVQDVLVSQAQIIVMPEKKRDETELQRYALTDSAGQCAQ